jgi:ABC-2 type transport system permease protein
MSDGTSASPTASIRASGPGGSIYDLGYQGYEGPRLGRPAAIQALFWHTVRSCYGIGRGGRAKIIPFALAGLAILPAILAVGIAAIAAQAGPARGAIEDASPIRAATYHGLVATLVMLFTAAQGPELLGRDQRFGVLPLYFSRVLARADYALAKALGLIAALLVLVLSPYLILFVGRVLAASDPLDGLSAEIPILPPAISQGLLTAGLLGSVATAIAAYTPRRAYATAAIIAVFIIPPIVAALIGRLTTGGAADLLLLLSPVDILDGTNAFLFDTFPDSPIVLAARIPGPVYVIAALVGIAASIGVTVRRFLRIAT